VVAIHGGAFLPEQGQLIPNLKGRKYPRPQDTWKQAIEDWFHPDPTAGLLVALKDWDLTWVQGMNSRTDSRGPKYHQRKLVAEEYMMYVQGLGPCCLCTDYECRYLDKHNGDRGLADSAFEQAFPVETAEGFTAILKKIQSLRKERGESRPRKKRKVAVARDSGD
jgi:hypothetical protein